jgi:hypothetical protein
MSHLLKPGDTVPRSGLYEIIGPRGGDTGKQITGVKGKTLPPTRKSGEGYRLADAAKHKRPKS